MSRNVFEWTPEFGYFDMIDLLESQADEEVEYLRELNPSASNYQINAYREGFMQGGLAAIRILFEHKVKNQCT